MNAEICSGVYSLPRTLTFTILLGPADDFVRDHLLFLGHFAVPAAHEALDAEKTVFFGLVTCWCLAVCPTSRSPFSVNATTDGVSRLPWELISTLG